MHSSAGIFSVSMETQSGWVGVICWCPGGVAWPSLLWVLEMKQWQEESGLPHRSSVLSVSVYQCVSLPHTHTAWTGPSARKPWGQWKQKTGCQGEFICQGGTIFPPIQAVTRQNAGAERPTQAGFTVCYRNGISTHKRLQLPYCVHTVVYFQRDMRAVRKTVVNTIGWLRV